MMKLLQHIMSFKEKLDKKRHGDKTL
ncbi:hypothetical protein E2C01_076735 [Portunus trituberculatus]|uniref:Uncharacterized protein n=1 Tax=Portunus trituberculatus TaxID=210409 RepID=A0A5B7IJE4_PORTR|nr:hypothetical protein [Portunus trituberculatus]